jgi:hypothetical protein
MNSVFARSGAAAPLNPGRGAFVSVGSQRELRDQQQAAGDVLERPIHAAGIVFENSIAEHALQQAQRDGYVVAALDTHERENAAANAAHVSIADGHRGRADALNECDQICGLRENLSCDGLCPVAIASPSP